MIRKSAKGAAFIITILCFIAVCFLTNLFVRKKNRKLIYFSKTTSFFSRILLEILDVKLKTKNLESLRRNGRNYLVVSNHVSYLDIFAIASVIPSIFIASVDEVKDRFMLGTVAKSGGSVFVERRNRASLSKEIETVSELLKEGLSVTLFPEGTTSNGDHILPFRTPFLIPAVKSGTDILPVCVKYLKINGESLNHKNRDLVFYYGDMTFFKHFAKLLSLESVDIELIGLESIQTRKKDISRKELATLAFSSITSALSSDG